MESHPREALVLVLYLIASSVTAASTSSRGASTAGVLVPIGQAWKFNQTGQDLGTAWKEVEYADDDWPSGPALFGRDTAPYFEPFPVPFGTPLTVYPPGDPNQIVTYYFRTHFPFSGSTTGLVLVGGMFLDDAAVYYLNGTEIGRTRIPPGQTYSTPPDGSQFYEGYYEITNFPADSLVQGDNVLAVEVHQSSYTLYTNVIFGMTLRGAWVKPITILRQPVAEGLVQGWPTTLSVNSSGTLPRFQWLKGGLPIPGATNSTYTIASTQPSNAGPYSVVITNSLGAVSSSNVDLAVTTPPAPFSLVSAISPGNHVIGLIFSGKLLLSTASNVANYGVSLLESGEPLAVSNVVAIGSQVALRGSPPFDSGSNFLVTVNGVQDTNGNVIASNTVVVVWGTPTNWVELIPFHAQWRSHREPLFEDLDHEWTRIRYDDSEWQGPRSAFFANTNFQTSDPIATRLPYTGATYYFRTTFSLPTSLVATSTVRFISGVKYGAVFYLNGQEIQRSMMNPGPVDYQTTAWYQSPSSPNSPTPLVTNYVNVSNLVAGINVLAAEVHHSEVNLIPVFGGDTSEMVFGAQLVANIQTRALPGITVERSGDNVVFRWTISNLALESADNLSGPWAPVAVDTSFYIPPALQSSKYYRLRD